MVTPSLPSGLSAFRDAFLDAPIGIVIVGLDHHFVDANPSFLNLLGYTADELRGMGELYNLTHPDDREVNTQLVAKLRAHEIPGFTVEKRYLTKKGWAVWVQVHTSLLRDGVTKEPSNILGLVVDITDRKRAEERARLEASRAQSVIESTSDGVYSLNRDWQLTYINRSAAQTVGFDRANLGKNFWELYPDAERTKIGPAFRRAMLERVPVEFEDFHGEPLNISYSASVYPTEEGITVFYRDITQRRRAELALRQSEKMAAVGRLAASIAHEINNPLEAITNLLYLAQQCDLSPEVAGYMQIAEQEVQRVSHITTLTLSFHRQLSTVSGCRARTLFESVLELYRGRLANSGITAVVGGGTKQVTETEFECLEGEIRQVLSNLLANAIDATPPGGKICLRAHDTHHRATGAPAVRLTIADTGQGMSAQVIAKIFQAFFTTKALKGTGLGLWLSKSIIENHSGELKVWSRPGRGTVFCILLPLTANPGLTTSPVVPT